MSSLRTLSVAFSSFLVFGCVNLLTQHSMTGAPARAFAMPNPLPQTTIPASNCQAMPVLCCQEVEPVRIALMFCVHASYSFAWVYARSILLQLKDLISEVESILDGAGITLPDLETLVGIDCNPTVSAQFRFFNHWTDWLTVSFLVCPAQHRRFAAQPTFQCVHEFI